MITVYQHPTCSTCQKARAVLDACYLTYQTYDIRETTPPIALLERALRQLPLGKVCNTSGERYRQEQWGPRLRQMTVAEQAAALHADGMLIKRPVVVCGDHIFFGFQEAQYRQWNTMQQEVSDDALQ